MTATDLDKVRSRFISAVTRFITGARLSKERNQAQLDGAPRLLEHTEYEVTDLSGLPGNDLDYYCYELARLQDAAREVCKIFRDPREVVEALERFDDAIPKLRDARNPLTHVSKRIDLDDFAWLGALLRLGPLGDVEYLVDPRYGDHDAAERLASDLLGFLRDGLESSNGP